MPQNFSFNDGTAAGSPVAAPATDEDVAAALRAAVAANPDGIASYTIEDRTATRFSPVELLKAQGILEARRLRARYGMFHNARPRRPT